MKKFNKNDAKISFLLFIISILTFFVLWVFFADNIKEIYVKKFRNTDINFLSKTDEKDLDLKKFWQVYNLLKEKYYSLDWVKKEDLVEWAISWMVNAIWDKHTEYMNKKEAKSFNETLSWDFQGIWAVVEKNELWVKIDRILKGSPAKKYWLKKWDIIIEANWHKLEWLSVTQAVAKIKWKAWTKVKLKIIRSWEKDILEKEVVRDKIKIPSVEEKTFDDYKNIWYIAINMYWENTAKEFKEALEKLKNKSGIIIDLRDNWGWYLQSAVEILSNFIENNKKLVEVKWKSVYDNDVYKSAWFWDKYKWKIVILINWNTASASEITTLALKDYNRVIIVWTKSYWKWSVQIPYSFPDWSELKFTIAKWFSPNWENIDGLGIKPDINVDFKKEDYDFNECKKVWKCPKNMKQKDFKFYDRQLEMAKKVLEEWIKTNNKSEVIGKFAKEI